MPITTAQIRGARGILNWSQSDLSEKTGISATSIGSIESGNSIPRAQTLDKIKIAFERENIEFLGLEGVKVQNNYIKVLKGKEGFKDFLDDVFHTIFKYGTQDNPTEVFLSNVVHENWSKWTSDSFWSDHADRMTKNKKIMDVRIIVKENDRNFPASDYAQYRWMPKNIFSEQSFYSYHDKLAFLNFKGGDVEITVIHQSEFAEGYRNLFRAAWHNIALVPSAKNYNSSEV